MLVFLVTYMIVGIVFTVGLMVDHFSDGWSTDSGLATYCVVAAAIVLGWPAVMMQAVDDKQAALNRVACRARRQSDLELYGY